MTQQIKIKSGSYKIRGKDVELAGMVFPMVEEFKMGAAGGYVTVDGKAIAGFPDRNIKIKVDAADDYELTRAKQLLEKRQMKRRSNVSEKDSKS